MPSVAVSPSTESHSWSLVYRKFSGMFAIFDPVTRIQNQTLFFALIERCRDNHRRKLFASYVNFKFLSDICKFCRHKSIADIFLQEWCRASRSDVANPVAIYVDVKTVARNSTIRHFKSDESSSQTFFFLSGDLVSIG